jgi:hypothetical protein
LEKSSYFYRVPVEDIGKFLMPTIEIINNTRGGIVILIQSKKGNVAIGGQKIKMLK